MTKLLVVLGSARTGRVADKINEYVTADIAEREGVSVTVADLKALDMPFFDNEVSPANPDYTPTDAGVIAWSHLVKEADAVVFITPEYNHSLSAIQKNAIDSLYAEWGNKPVTAVTYGWSAGAFVVPAFREILGNVKADIKATFAQLAFMKDINPDGSLLDVANVTAQIAAAIDQVTNVKTPVHEVLEQVA